MNASFYCRSWVLLAGIAALLFNPQFVSGQVGKDKGVPKKEPAFAAVPLELKAGEALSEMSLVQKPAPIKGLLSWAIETKKHRGFPSSFSVSPDGTLAATGGYDGTVRVWDAATGNLLHALVGHNSSVYGVAFSPDGSLLASTGSFDKSARIWDAKTGMTVKILKNHKGFTSKLAWAPDGKMLAVAGGTSGFVTFWDMVQFKQVRTVEHGVAVNGIAWSPDGKIVACATEQNATLWNPADGSNITSLKMEGNKVLAVAWSPDSKMLLTGGLKATNVWDLAMSKTIGVLPGTGNVVSWSPDGEKIATSYGGGMQTWNGKSALREQVYEIPAQGFGWDKKTGELYIMTSTEVLLQNITEEKKPKKFEIAASDTLMWSSGRPLVSGLSDKTAKFWDATTGKPLAELSGHTEKILAAAWSSDGKFFATGSADMTAKIWDGKTGKLLRSLVGASKPVKAVAWSPDGKLATASEDKIVRVYAPNSDKAVEMSGHTHPVAAVAWSRDGKLVSGGEDGKVVFWDAAGKSTKALEIDHDVMALGFSPDGNFLAVGSNDDTTRIFAVTGGAMALKTLSGQNGAAEFYNLSWSPDGSLIATTNYRMQLWNAKSDKLLHGFHIAGAVNNIAWSPDGRTTVGGCVDRGVRFCETATGRLRATMICDDKQVVTVSGDGHYKVAPDLEPELVYVGQTDKALEMLDLKAFQAKYGWKNNPAMVKVLGN